MTKKCSCGKWPSFGIINGTPTHCKTCKDDTMENVVNKKCLCGKRPIFGLPGGAPTHCKSCKTDSMCDVRNALCLCGKRASCGINEKKPTHCSKCKTTGMRNVVNKKCKCGKHPNFGLNDGVPTHCAKCRTDDMRDVVNKKCLCGKHPSFGVVKGQATHCAECKKDGMVNVVSKKCQKCEMRFPSFGFVNGVATHCAECKEDEMENIKKKRCRGYNGESCPTGYILAPGRDYCLACDPDTTRYLPMKRDEAAFFNFLDKSDIKITQREYPIHFECIDTNKKRAHIDGVIITKDIVVCIELDEDAHDSYEQTCERARMHNATAELRLVFPDHSVAWVRVNPHTKNNGKRDTSKKAMKIRDQRHLEALKIIKDILQTPQDCIEYVGY
ncbi:hypothetical protein ATCVTN60342_787R [Acanthocystis turfacea Chlorella virus TN603.4.2]|nr:hypothetical protein ATCVTN60342_787R [Acanthocystis turfacea Chlorella virus TN603.4.2]